MSNEILLYRGDNKTYEVTIRDSDGVVVDLSGATIKFTVKASVKDTTAKIELTNADQSEIEDSDMTNGIFKIHFVPANTSGMRASKYIYDIEITLVGKIYTVIKDKLQLRADVTR